MHRLNPFSSFGVAKFRKVTSLITTTADENSPGLCPLTPRLYYALYFTKRKEEFFKAMGRVIFLYKDNIFIKIFFV